MIDLSNAKSDLTPRIQFVVKWLNDNGFDVKLLTYNTKKTVFEVQKAGVTDTFEITASRENSANLEEYLAFLSKSFDLKIENERLKRELQYAGIQ